MRMIEEVVFGPFRLDREDEQLWRDGQMVALRPKALAVLRYLLERAPRLVKKQELLDALWPGVAVGDAVLTTSLKEIRRALRDSARQPRYVETAHGRGYRFIGPIELASVARSHAPAANRARQVSASAEPPPIGRERQRAVLEAALGRARTGQRQLLFVTGEPGIGKTTLLDAFLAEATGEHHVFVARSRCVAGHAEHEAYLPLRDAFARLFRSSAASPLCARLAAAAPSWFSSSAAASVDPRTRPARAAAPSLRELAEALEHGTEQSALVLCLDDLHFADAATLALVHYLAQRPEPARLLIVCSYGALEGSAAQRQHLRRLERGLRERRACGVVSVDLLDESEVHEYIARRFPGHRFPGAFSAFVHSRTTGKPSFVRELLESWGERGWIAVSQDGQHELTCALERLTEDVPASITAAIEAELRALAPLPRSILQAGSIAGREFSALAVARALCLSASCVERECLELHRHGRYLRKCSRLETHAGVTSHCFAFVHALQREVIAEGLGVARRSELERRLGAVQHAHVAKTLAALAFRVAPDNDAVAAPRHKLPLVAP